MLGKLKNVNSDYDLNFNILSSIFIENLVSIKSVAKCQNLAEAINN